MQYYKHFPFIAIYHKGTQVQSEAGLQPNISKQLPWVTPSGTNLNFAAMSKDRGRFFISVLLTNSETKTST